MNFFELLPRPQPPCTLSGGVHCLVAQVLPRQAAHLLPEGGGQRADRAAALQGPGVCQPSSQAQVRDTYSVKIIVFFLRAFFQSDKCIFLRVDGVFLQRFQCTGSILPAAPPTGNGFRFKRRGDSKLRPAVDRFIELFRLLLFYRRATSHCGVYSTFFSRVIVGSRHASLGRGVRKEG